MLNKLFSSRGSLVFAAIWCTITLPNLACAQEEETPISIRSTLDGRLTVRTEVETSTDYRDFEVLVALDKDGEPDTLGFAITDSTGRFLMNITAPERGVYALVISRRGQILTVGQLAVAEGDSASLSAAFPLGNRTFRVRSMENSAWQAYQNSLAQHDRQLVELVQTEGYNEEVVRQRVAQTAMILWDMQNTFPGTMGSEVAMAEAVVMEAGWNDSLAVARARVIPSNNIQFGDVGRVVRQATARLEGHEAALAVLEDFARRATNDEHRAQLASERVLAHADSSQFDAALAAAAALQEDYANSPWAQWAARTAYDIEHLRPGMAAPNFAVRDVAGDSLHLADLRGRHVVLEFYRPEDDVYQRELEGRNSLVTGMGTERLAMVSISLQPDTLINEAFFEEREAPGIHVYGAGDLVQAYNVNVVPTRFLIDPEGRLVSKFVGGAMAAIYDYLMAQ